MAGGSGRLVIFSWNTEPDLVEASLAAGASGYIPKGIPAKELVDLIEAVHRGEKVLPSTVPTPPSKAQSRAKMEYWMEAKVDPT
mgnify:CR=1 FL=1